MRKTNTNQYSPKLDYYDSTSLHKGLDYMDIEQIINLPIGRLVDYTDILFNQYVEYVRDNTLDRSTAVSNTISKLSRRERLIIARAFKHTYMTEDILIPVTSPQMYCINGITEELFSLYITMIENNENNIDEMTDIIDKISNQDKSIMLINLDMCKVRGNYR